MKKILFIIIAAVLLFAMVGCDDANPTPDKVQAQQQRQSMSEANKQVGMPGITNYTEKKLVKKLYELRDGEVATYTYVFDMQGRLWHVCDSIGYGLPYGVQFSNPERPAEAWETHEAGNIALPQAEPNGLFMPPTADGTWVMCADPNKKGEIRPILVEPRVITSTFKLKSVGSYSAE